MMWLDSSFVVAFADAVLCFLWLGSVIAFAIAALLWLLPKTASEARYFTSTLGLFSFPFVFLALVWIFQSAGGSPGLSAISGDSLPTFGYWVFGVWLLGVAFLSFRLFRKVVESKRLRKVGTRRPDSSALALFEDLRKRLRLPSTIGLLESGLVSTPMVVGWFSPVVLVPVGMLCSLTRQEARAVICHELAHLKRLDPSVNFLQELIELFLFFHPATWWLTAVIRKEREFCCDDFAARVTGDPLALARSLTFLESCRHFYSPGMGANGGSLYERISRLLRKADHLDEPIQEATTNSTRRSSGRKIGAVLGVLLVLGGIVVISGQSNERTVEKIVTGISVDEIPSAPDWVEAKGDFEQQIHVLSRFIENSESDGGIEVIREMVPQRKLRIDTRFVEMGEGVYEEEISEVKIMNEAELQQFVRKLSETKGVDLFTAPSLTLQEGQKASVEVARKFIMPPQEGGSGYDEVDLGVMSHFLSRISGDDTTVDLDVFAQVIDFEGFVDGEQKRESARFDCVTLSTALNIPEGNTAIFGGVIKENRIQIDDKVPLLGDLPLLGRFFRESREETHPSRLVMMVTPRYIEDDGSLKPSKANLTE